MDKLICSRALRGLGVLAVATLLTAPGLAAQTGSITGQVSSAQGGQALSATQVYIAELDLGVLSQANGRFLLLNVPAGTHTLTASRIGYRVSTVQVTVAAGETVPQNFLLTEEALQLDEVIVTGTVGGAQRRAIGNVVAAVDVGEITAGAPITQLEDVLIGRTPGVHLQPATGAGGGSKIRIRGHSSVGVAGDPIIYVDGVRVNDNRTNVDRFYNQSTLADFDPNNIESIEIIKGPAAATLYGTEASDGVIQIVTKRGQAGAPVYEFSTELGQNYWPAWDGYERLTYAPNPNAGCTVQTVPCTSEDQLIGFNLRDHSIQQGFQDAFQNGLVQRYNAAVRGGTDVIRYSFSLARSDQEGIVYWNTDERNTVQANIGVTPNERISIQLSGTYAQGVYHDPEAFWGGEYGWGAVPTGYFNADGTVASCGDRAPQGLGPEDVDANGNPCTSLQNRGWRDGGPERYDPSRFNNFTRSKRSTWSLQTTLDVTEWLSHRLVVGLDQIYEREETFVAKEGDSFWWGTNGREGDKSVSVRDHPVWTVDFSGTATTRLMDGLLGTSTSYGMQYYTRAEYTTNSHGEDFVIRALSTVSAANESDASETFLENTTFGLYVQEQLDWDNRIFLTAAVRGDDNSAFGKNYEAAIYPKLSATWVMHEEDFWNIDWVDQFRIRGAWGKAGKQPSTFAATQLFFPLTGPGAPILSPDPSQSNQPGTIGNPDLGPEVGEEIEVGFDASIFDGRIGGAFTFYRRWTRDAIIPQTIPPSLWPPRNNEPSDPVQFVNIGQISNWGTETSLSIQAVTEGPVRLDLDLAFTTQGNRIDDMGPIERLQQDRSRAHYEGYAIASVSDKRVLSADWVDPVAQRGQVTNIMCDGGVGPQTAARPYGVEFGGAPVPCETAPRLVWGPTDPTRLLNVTPTATIFNDWRLSANFDAQWGHWMAHDYLTARYTSHPSSKAVWLQDDPIAMAYISTTRNGFGNTRAGFLKLREVSLSYNMPQSITERIGASAANIRIGARNVARLWLQNQVAGDEKLKYPELVSDPEIGRSVYNFAGEDGGGWPPIPQWTVRLGVTF